MMDFHHIMMLIHHKLYDSYKLYYCHHLHQMPHQLFDVLVPLLADQPGVVVTGEEEKRVGAEEIKLSVARRHNVDAKLVLHVHLGGIVKTVLTSQFQDHIMVIVWNCLVCITKHPVTAPTH